MKGRRVMDGQKKSEMGNMLGNLKKKLLFIFVIGSVIGAILFLLSEWDIIPVIISILFIVIFIVLYIYLFIHQLQFVISQIKSTIHWYEEILDAIDRKSVV